MFRERIIEVGESSALAFAIVDTVRQPLVVLDQDMRVVTANRSFYLTFTLNPGNTQGKHLCELGDGEWNIPRLHSLLSKIIAGRGVLEDFEVEGHFPGVGRRRLLLNARDLFREVRSSSNILLDIEDVTSKRAVARENDRLSRCKGILLDEIHHRVGNSLQIIASILLMRAKTVESDETRRNLHEAHQRVISVATLQRHLRARGAGETVELMSYISMLCDALTNSMICDNRPISLKVCGEKEIVACRSAESLGLIVTELIINSLKHAFNENTKNAQIVISYCSSGENWKLTIADNGIGNSANIRSKSKPGLGTAIVKALAAQLDARVLSSASCRGTIVSITHTHCRQGELSNIAGEGYRPRQPGSGRGLQKIGTGA